MGLKTLEKILISYKNDKRIKIGSFTCASNITGIILYSEKAVHPLGVEPWISQLTTVRPSYDCNDLPHRLFMVCLQSIGYTVGQEKSKSCR